MGSVPHSAAFGVGGSFQEEQQRDNEQKSHADDKENAVKCQGTRLLTNSAVHHAKCFGVGLRGANPLGDQRLFQPCKTHLPHRIVGIYVGNQACLVKLLVAGEQSSRYGDADAAADIAQQAVHAGGRHKSCRLL